MNFRAALFIFLSFIILMVSVLMRPAPEVGIAPDDGQAQVEQVADGDGVITLADGDKSGEGNVAVTESKSENGETDSQETQSPEPEVAEKTAESVDQDDTDDKSATAATTPDEDAEVRSKTPVAGVGPVLTNEQIEELITSRRPAKTPEDNALLNSWCYRAQEMQGDLTTIGSLAPDSGQRYLITANAIGGTLRRIELNHRKENGRHFYRDLEITYGYIGSLDCFDSSDGCKVGIVGAGTPAEAAGLKKGDIIESIGDVAIVSKFDFETALAKTKPGEALEIDILRDGEKSKVSVTLGEKPIELIRPEPSMIDPTRKLIESFSLSLMKPSSDINKLWDALGDNMLHGLWDVRKTNIDGADAIEFTYKIESSDLEELEVSGPLRVVKRYILPEFKASEELDPGSFHWQFEIEVFNDSDKKQQLGYSLIGPIGTPSETWWYANKIYGGGGLTGIGGARDVSASLPEKGYVFAGNADVIRNLKEKPPEPTFVISPYDTVTKPEKWSMELGRH